ncbi:permease [Acinetobacter sp. ANC 4558]|uniref:permease n=1 Tax=Acinetobacter sp. ANC 4558 TaxID=1977876 RepID=UPI000A3430B2|nr:permease [Acinetobacter sp. ANC 4558]OTG85594.1 permease [Acinetobacter sp. ANC 4558]
MSLILPLCAFLCGLLIAQIMDLATITLKKVLSSVLAKFFIPVVIVYNLVFYQAGSLSLIIFSFFVSIILFYLYKLLTQKPLEALCFSYVNMAWLGFPFAIALFGPSVSAPIVAIYIGGSIFGNIWAVTALSSEQESIWKLLNKVLKSPPIIAIIIALSCRMIGLQNYPNHVWIDLLYSCAKVGMSFSGMCILGIWLRRTKVYLDDFINSLYMAIYKIGCGIVICTLTYFWLPIPNIEHYIGVMFLLFCLPPAANIVALETYYHGTGDSAKMIASGTIVSCVIVLLYGVILHLF